MSNSSGVVGFWSYSHLDDERDTHGLTRLASHIADEFALVTGDTLTLFMDRNDIRWGDEWKRRIDAALAETTFFIPVITPLYFKRQECMRELLSFVGQAQSLGAIELVMPILYVDVPGLTEDSADEARALIARMQYIDWREIRLRGENSPEYRRGVHDAAMRLAEISSQYEQRDNQPVYSQTVDEEEGLIDLLAVLEERLPAWREAVDRVRTTIGQFDALTDPFVEGLNKREKAGFSAGARLSILRNYSLDIEPIIRRSIEAAESYSSLTIEMNPVFLALFRMLETYSLYDNRDVLKMLDAVADVKQWIDEDEKDALSLPQWEEFVKKYKGVSKDLAKTIRLIDASTRLVEAANPLVKNWDRELTDYQARAARK